MTVGIIEMDIHKCQFKGSIEFCKHFNGDKNLLWHQYFTNTPEMYFYLGYLKMLSGLHTQVYMSGSR